MLYVAWNRWDFLHPARMPHRGQHPWAFQRPLRPSPTSAPLPSHSEVLVRFSYCSFLGAPGKGTKGLLIGVLCTCCWKPYTENVCFYWYLLVQCKINICSPRSMWAALWRSHPSTKALGMAIARPVLEISINQLIYSAKYIMNMQSWLCTSVSS